MDECKPLEEGDPLDEALGEDVVWVGRHKEGRRLWAERQGLTLVHFTAQRKRFARDRGRA